MTRAQTATLLAGLIVGMSFGGNAGAAPPPAAAPPATAPGAQTQLPARGAPGTPAPTQPVNPGQGRVIVNPGQTPSGVVDPGRGNLPQNGTTAQPGSVNPGAALPGTVNPGRGDPALDGRPTLGGTVNPGYTGMGVVDPGRSDSRLVSPGEAPAGAVSPGQWAGSVVHPGQGLAGVADPGNRGIPAKAVTPRDFVVVGPGAHPAGTLGVKDSVRQRIAKSDMALAHRLAVINTLPMAEQNAVLYQVINQLTQEGASAGEQPLNPGATNPATGATTRQDGAYWVGGTKLASGGGGGSSGSARP